MKGRRITQEQIETIRKLHGRGMSIPNIARRVDLSTTVLYQMRREGRLDMAPETAVATMVPNPLIQSAADTPNGQHSSHQADILALRTELMQARSKIVRLGERVKKMQECLVVMSEALIDTLREAR